MNDHEEKIEEVLADVHLEKFVEQNHMPRAGDGKPFGDALDNAEDNRNKQIIEHVFPFRKPRERGFLLIDLFLRVFILSHIQKRHNVKR